MTRAALQLEALKKLEAKPRSKMTEYRERRPSALLRCLKKLGHGDTLTVWKLD
jgi:hypothetical protein